MLLLLHCSSYFVHSYLHRVLTSLWFISSRRVAGRDFILALGNIGILSLYPPANLVLLPRRVPACYPARGRRDNKRCDVFLIFKINSCCPAISSGYRAFIESTVYAMYVILYKYLIWASDQPADRATTADFVYHILPCICGCTRTPC